jgi:uncharacterized DUF497 family protein
VHTIARGSEWDPSKARANLAKHGVRFADGIAVLQDPLAVTVRDSSVDDEDRFVTIGTDDRARLLVVVYMARGKRSVDLRAPSNSK